MKIYRVIVRAFVVLLQLGMVSFASAREHPNIIVVLIDDMGWSDLSSFHGHRIRTENIDALAAEGIRFTNFYVNAPICSPSRVALTTGQYPQKWRITSYLAWRTQNDERGMAQWLDPKAPTLARQLQQAGYATGHFGKWHMGGQRDVGEAPLITEYGFERSLTNLEGLGSRLLPITDAYDGKPPQRNDLGSAKLGRGPIRWVDRSVATAAYVEAAIKFVNRAQQDSRPFYLNIWPEDVHSPFFPPKAIREKTKEQNRALYYAVLDTMDEQLGVLFDRVRLDPGLSRNTLILVMSDNGPENGAGLSHPLRGSKGWLYEGGVRSPLIVWGPGLLAQAAAGRRNKSSVLSAIDVNRSLYTIANVSPVEGAELDGEDLAGTLLGRQKRSRSAPIFWRRPPSDKPEVKNSANPDLAVRDKKWKYYVNYDGSNEQLYDLDTDRSELNNVVEINRDTSKRLRLAIKNWNESMPADAGDPHWKPQ